MPKRKKKKIGKEKKPKQPSFDPHQQQPAPFLQGLLKLTIDYRKPEGFRNSEYLFLASTWALENQ